MTCLMGLAVGILSTALSGSVCAWTNVPRLRINANNIDEQKKAFACNLPVALRCIRPPTGNQTDRSLVGDDDLFVLRRSRLSETLVMLQKIFTVPVPKQVEGASDTKVNQRCGRCRK